MYATAQHSDDRMAFTGASPAASAGRLDLFDVLLLLTTPIIGWLLLGISLVNQDNFIDPWFYLGYGRAFPTFFKLFGWSYYAVRFPVVFANRMFAWRDPILGFAVLRYLLLLACGLPLYLWARNAFGRAVAVPTYLALFCCPLLPRILLWDLTTFVSVPMALSGMALWLWSSSAKARFLSGFCWMAAVASHAFTGTAVATFVLVQLSRRLRAREYGGLMLLDLLMAGVGAATCVALGWLYYRSQIGSFDPRLFYTITASVVAVGNKYAETHRTPFGAWGAREYHVYVPYICVGLAGVLLGRRILRNTTEASVWWFSLAYSLVYLGYQFVLGRFILETFYYFAHLTPVVFLLVPIIMNELLSSVPESRRTGAIGAIVLALLILPLMNRLAPAGADAIERASAGSTATLIGCGIVTVVLLGIAGRLARRPSGGTSAAAAFVVVIQVLTFLNPLHRQVFDVRHQQREQGLYLAAVDMLSVFTKYATPATRVMLWHCPRQFSVGAIASTVLLFTINDPFSAAPEVCTGTIGVYERTRLMAFSPRYLLMMDDSGESDRVFTHRDELLAREGYSLREVVARRIGDDAYHAQLRLVALERSQP